LVSPTGSTSVPYKLYVSLENVRLFGAASAQSGIGIKENALKMSGPISSVATNFARGFSEFAKVPLISSYAKSAQWVMDRTARAASIFGFSKPTGGDNITKMSILNNAGHCNIDGTADSRSLGLLQLLVQFLWMEVPVLIWMKWISLLLLDAMLLVLSVLGLIQQL
jgi:hypothetical protein